ncbi:MAG: M64 family metallopeptidase [Phycisphaerales bacterium JB040]
MTKRRHLSATLVPVAACALSHAHPPSTQPEDGTETVHVCWPIDDSGALTGVRFQQAMDPIVTRMLNPQERDASGDNRLDLVFVGDGYTADELGQYASDVANVTAGFFSYEPFIAYEPYFRITQVDVVSPESGVDNDPTQGVSRNTALDMAYWCNGIERLLCVNVAKAYNAIDGAGVPDVDQVLALANSSKYGGAGYSGSDLGTAAGRNGSAVEIAIHEMGHSLGNLADEYTYGGPDVYAGGEPGAANSSVYDAGAQTSQQRKWYRWLGASGDPRFDDPIGTFEGSSYSPLGVYRPSNNSMMRSLFRQFNQPSAEALIRAIYQEVSPIDDAAPAGVYTQADTLWVTPMRPVGHTLDVSWLVDGDEQVAFDGQTGLGVSDLGLPEGTYTLTARVVDNTDMVRDPALRANLMTDTRSWTIQIACDPIADLSGDGVVDNADIGVFVGLFLASDPEADFNADGVLDNGDIAAFVEAFLSPCEHAPIT